MPGEKKARIRQAPTAIAGACRVCACTDLHGCESGCAWTDITHTLCTVCEDAGEIAARLVYIASRLDQMAPAGFVLPVPEWEALPFAHQQLLIMGVRRELERGILAATTELGEDVLGSILDLNELGDFLQRECPQELLEHEAIVETAMRLLKPHVGTRVQLA